MFCPVCGASAAPTDKLCGICASSLSPLQDRSPGPRDRRVTPTDLAIASSFGSEILLGKAFAFLAKAAFNRPSLSWVQQLLGEPKSARPRVISLFGSEPVRLPGATVTPLWLPSVALASVTSDKASYREGRDEVHLYALDPFSPGAEAVLMIKAHGADFGKHPVRLDPHGAAAVTLSDLPAGEYEVRLRNAPREATPCAFTVAEYRLAPLVGALVDRRLDAGQLALTIRVESFGRPVEGAVHIELTERGTRLAHIVADAADGVVRATFALSGEGPHAVTLQLVSDPSRTASVPIVGSRTAERSRTTFSTLGSEVTGSLLPSEGSRPVRGIFLEEGAFRTTPFRLERVDTRKARLIAATSVETARIVVVDPTFPLARAGAVDPVTAPHPAMADERYRRGERLFHEGKIAEARAAFEDGIAASPAPHPNYAYFIACCHAHEGDLPRAIGALRAAIFDGWSDFGELERDPDLSALRGYPGYEALKRGRRREIAIEDVIAGTPIEIDVPEPIALIAIGAYAGGEPWEGWATVIAPSSIAPTISVPAGCTPGSEAQIEIDSGRADDDASLYVIVKDARLLTSDTPASRLASGLKAFADCASKDLAVGKPSETLADSVPPPPSSTRTLFAASLMDQPTPFNPVPELSYGSTGGSPVPPPPSTRRTGLPAVPSQPAAVISGPSSQRSRTIAQQAALNPPISTRTREAATPGPAAFDEPEVLFAGLVATKGGRATISLGLAAESADYKVEAFATRGLDWASAEARFRAEEDVFVALDLPAFVHPGDAAMGRVHVGSRSGAHVRVTRDGAEVPLIQGDVAIATGERIEASRAELSFLAGPGLYEASLEGEPGAAPIRASKRVDAPGKIRRTARAVRLLEPGQSVSRDEDPAILGLRVLPGLKRPFHALLDAVADYGHACCEQTAAKMLAASAMYTLADADDARREQAEAIIVAGIRREASMWLRGRGFKLYPESPGDPDRQWGPKTARHLWSLTLLRDRPGRAALSRALAGALDQGMAMADDTSRAYRVDWPPQQLSSCEDAYAAIRFGKADSAALGVVRQRTACVLREALPGAPPAPHFGGAVAMRSEVAYGAAALLRAGGDAERQRAIRLADAVVRQIDDSGRLYSTVDSVAAIALMVELHAANIGGDGGEVEIDGERLSTRSAADRDGDARAIRCLEGVTAVEVTRTIEEDWDTWSTGLALVVSLTKGGAPTRVLNALDSVELVVRIERGYKPGDVCWVCLPDALSWVVGGEQVKRFSIDFRGKSELRIPLAATGVTLGPDGEQASARFAVCVRNMFEEERGGNPGLLEVTVLPAVKPAGS
jgi:hypothetical protein